MSAAATPLLGLAGWSGAGKTTLMVALLPLLREAGFTVATIKHAHHRVQLDTPGKDSDRHRQAGAVETILATESGWALFHPHPSGRERLAALAMRFAPADLILVEGFRNDPIPKLEIYRPALGKPVLYRDDPFIEALATTDAHAPEIAAFSGPIFTLGEPAAIAAWIAARLRQPG